MTTLVVVPVAGSQSKPVPLSEVRCPGQGCRTGVVGNCELNKKRPGRCLPGREELSRSVIDLRHKHAVDHDRTVCLSRLQVEDRVDVTDCDAVECDRVIDAASQSDRADHCAE